MKSVRTRSIGKFQTVEGVIETDSKVNREIDRAFKEYRAFSGYLNTEIIESIRRGNSDESIHADLRSLCSGIFAEISGNDQNLLRRFEADTRLIRRIINAFEFLHRACAELDNPLLNTRRFVLIKERHGYPTYFHEFNVATVISHVGSGLRWKETPSVYLGLNLFDFLSKEKKSGQDTYYKIFKQILSIEERAIETGYYHTDPVPVSVSRQIQNLIDQIIRYTDLELEEITETLTADLPDLFTGADRDRLIALLDARLKDDFTNFDYHTVMSGMNELEELARKYKENSSKNSLYQVVRLLTAAAGHDIHEVRNRANIALERVFAPKEYDAPVATRFLNVKTGEKFSLTFEMPDESGVTYSLRLYHTPAVSGLIAQSDLVSEEVALEKKADGLWEAEFVFHETGQKDFVLLRNEGGTGKYVSEWQASGRINIIPDVRGEVILEIFTDIHGHTRVYWRTNTEHPGLVYNENGEVIRLGRFSDITDHLEDLKSRYHLTALYLLGVQKRGSNREDWAPGATSPSPFSPMSLTEFEDYLGGEKEFRELTEKAHSLGIKIIIDIIPHLNRHSRELPDEYAVRCYDGNGNLVFRASTDGRYGSWDDGRLLNYRMFEVWEWLAESVEKLIEKYDIDGIRFDSAHAVPIIMKRNNYPYIYSYKRSHEEMLEGRIIVNDVEYGHFVTTGYYDSACRDFLAVPFHFFLMQRVERSLRRKGKNYFINLAECYWGHERFLARSGVIPYNSALFKICENILHGKSDVREIYHIYDWYYPSVLPPGTEMLGILGNHDERRALNTFGLRGLRAAVGITLFLSNIIMDYEGSAEGEGWKVYLDNIYVNWNQFEYAANRSLENFYREWYSFHRTEKGKGYTVWANNHYVAAAVKFTDQGIIWIGAFNFSNENQAAAIQFDNPRLPLDSESAYILEDPLYSPITKHYSHITGRELKNTKIHTVVSYTERIKLLRMRPVALTKDLFDDFFRDSFFRMCSIPESSHFPDNFSFMHIAQNTDTYKKFIEFTEKVPVRLFAEKHRNILELGMKRALYYAFEHGYKEGRELLDYIDRMTAETSPVLKSLGQSLKWHYGRGSFIFLSAEAEPFSRSGGLGNVVAELPRELTKLGEEMIVITGYYRHGDEKSVRKMRQAAEQHEVKYTGKNVKFFIGSAHYEVGVHTCRIEGVTYYLLDHYELFDGLYWGITAEEKLRRRIGFARAAAEVICTFGLAPNFTISNDAYTGLFNGLVRSDPNYYNNPNFHRNTYLHMIHNGGWQYFDAFYRWENGWDHFSMFNIPYWKAADFMDPVHADRINCMAAGVRFADRTITVSPSYAKQIEHACDGLEHILHNVIGISNAIDSGFLKRIQNNFRRSGFQEQYYPKLSEHIKADRVLEEKLRFRYPEILKGPDAVELIKDEGRRKSVRRMMNKLMIQIHHGFEVDPDIILFSMIHRITEQKGFQLLLEASEGIFKKLKYQAVIGGAVASGDRRGEEIAHGLWLLSQYYPSQVSVSFGFQDISIPLQSSDLFCMPSLSEPGGISQLEAFATGNLVVARATGGLRDTVNPITIEGKSVKGNGFLFSDYSAHAFYNAMERASEFFSGSSEGMIAQARQNAEESVYYWDRPARKYIKELYKVKEVIRIL